MILYTEKQLEDSWLIDCLSRVIKNKPQLTKQKYRELFEACLELLAVGKKEQANYYLKTFDLQIPNNIINSITDDIDLELDYKHEH